MHKLLIILYICFAAPCMGQSKLPDVNIKSLSGKEIPFNTVLAGGDTATIVSFWATWCIPCVTELDIINDKLSRWQKDALFKIVAVSVDDTRTSAKVRSFVAGKGWNFDSYLDPNNDLKRAMNVSDIPYILIIKDGKIIYQHNGYIPGSEEELPAKLKGF